MIPYIGSVRPSDGLPGGDVCNIRAGYDGTLVIYVRPGRMRLGRTGEQRPCRPGALGHPRTERVRRVPGGGPLRALIGWYPVDRWSACANQEPRNRSFGAP
ncbi:hypothetical protein GCM10010343_70260 [Streptomyces avidinii]|nr:hypothetical protein GCM10010343_70260 [Streptomyces avidinii]